jgi:hypothetical protein
MFLIIVTQYSDPQKDYQQFIGKSQAILFNEKSQNNNLD